MTRLVIATDGYVASDGHGGWAFIVQGESVHHQESGALHDAPSHLAEWIAVQRALEWASAHAASGDHIDLRTDSALVAKGLASRRPSMSGEASERRAACRIALAALAGRGIRTRVQRVPRHLNAAADEAARRAAAEVETE